MKQIINFVILTLILGLSVNSFTFSQERQSGIINASAKVVDQTGEPVSGAIIHANSGATVVRTALDGSFTVSISPNSIILVEAKGYATKRFVVVDPQAGELILEKQPFQLAESDEVNIPFGKMKKRHLVGSVTVLNPEDFIGYDSRTSVNVALSGRVPGLFGNTNIYGIGAITVIDGIPRPLDFINLHEVQQITIIKDASTRMLYGAQAEQPVILVTTKRGTALKRTITAHVESGINNPVSYPSYLGAATYMELFNEARQNDGLPLRYSADQIANTRNRTNLVLHPDEDYYNNTFLRDFKNYHNVFTEFSGGNDAAQYYAFIGWNNQNSLVSLGRDESINKINIRGNVDYEINSFMKMRFDGITVFDISNQAPRVDFWGLSSTLRPNLYPMLIPLSEIDDNESYAGSRPIDDTYLLGGTTEFQTNLYGELTRGGYQNTNTRILQFNTGLDLDLDFITDGLTASSFLTFDIYNRFNTELNDTYAVYQPFLDADESLSVVRIGQDSRAGNETVSNPDFFRRVGLYSTVKYNKLIGQDHAIDITGVAYRDMMQVSGATFREKNLHFGFRGNYNFRNKYIGELGGVLAGSPRFATQSRFAFSPSIGFAWIASEENFWGDGSVVNFFKIRSSWANIHTDAGIADYYLYQTSYNQRWWFDYNHGVVRNRVRDVIALGNENLGWINREKLSTGIEAGVLNNLFWFEAGYFNSRISNVMTRRINYYPAFYAGVIPYENYNSYKDEGFEGGLAVNPKFGDLHIQLGSNLIYAVPTVLQIDEPTYDWDYRQRVNQPTDAIFGYVALGLFADQEEIANHPLQTFGPVRPGDIKYKDLNNDGVINEDDQMIIGNFRSRFQYSLNLRVNYKSVELFVLGTGQTGGNNIYNNPYYWVFGERKYSEVVLDRWTPATASTATYPALSSGSGANNFRNSTFWLENDNYFTIHATQISYKLPETFLQRLSIKGVKLYFRGHNLITFSQIKDKKELTIGSEPQYRSFALGINATF
jgi:TonB-linked SusC/RagA family outer membrane protein